MPQPKYQIDTRPTPGQPAQVVSQHPTLAAARHAASRYLERADLRRQDVRIERYGTGELVEYAGPAR
jgi:hypothetical protein